MAIRTFQLKMQVITEVINNVHYKTQQYIATMSLDLWPACLILHQTVIMMEVSTSVHLRRLTRRKSERYCLICWAILMSKSNSARTIGAFSLISRRSASNRISFSLSAPVTPPLTFLCCKTNTSTEYILHSQLILTSIVFKLTLFATKENKKDTSHECMPGLVLTRSDVRNVQ